MRIIVQPDQDEGQEKRNQKAQNSQSLISSLHHSNVESTRVWILVFYPWYCCFILLTKFSCFNGSRDWALNLVERFNFPIATANWPKNATGKDFFVWIAVFVCLTNEAIV